MNSRFSIYYLFFFVILLQVFCSPAFATTQSWKSTDKKVEDRIYQINVGIDVRLKDGPWVQLTGLSPKQHYYVFTTVSQDQGYQIVGHGSCFPMTTTNKQKVFFVTCKHVLDEATETIEECQMFYAAMQLYASKTSMDADSQPRRKELMNAVNLFFKKDLNTKEKNACAQTVNAIWDYYDSHLSKRADPKRQLYNKYKKLASLQVKTVYMLHAPGPVAQAPIQAKVYKTGQYYKPDLAILMANSITQQSIKTLALAPIPPYRGQEIQAAGYPIASQPMNIELVKYYSPVFTNGKIMEVASDNFGFDAPINNGNSGGPVIDSKGQVLGVVMRKADFRNHRGACDLYGPGARALSVRVIKSFVPELFQAYRSCSKSIR